MGYMHSLHKFFLKGRVCCNLDKLHPSSLFLRLISFPLVNERHTRSVACCITYSIYFFNRAVREHTQCQRGFPVYMASECACKHNPVKLCNPQPLHYQFCTGVESAFRKMGMPVCLSDDFIKRFFCLGVNPNCFNSAGRCSHSELYLCTLKCRACC